MAIMGSCSLLHNTHATTHSDTSESVSNRRRLSGLPLTPRARVHQEASNRSGIFPCEDSVEILSLTVPRLGAIPRQIIALRSLTRVRDHGTKE